MAAIEKPEDQRKNQAQQQTSDQRKIKSHVFAAINDVARQTPQGQMKFAGKETHETRQSNNAAHRQQEFSQVNHATILADEPAKDPARLVIIANIGPVVLFAC